MILERYISHQEEWDGAGLRELRLSRGLTQHEVAHGAKLLRKTMISKYENNQAIPNRTTAKAMFLFIISFKLPNTEQDKIDKITSIQLKPLQYINRKWNDRFIYEDAGEVVGDVNNYYNK